MQASIAAAAVAALCDGRLWALAARVANCCYPFAAAAVTDTQCLDWGCSSAAGGTMPSIELMLMFQDDLVAQQQW